MNREQLLQKHDQVCAAAKALMEKKNHDYSGNGANESIFGNLISCEKLGMCKMEMGILIRMQDKLARLQTFVQAGQLKVKDEVIQDSVQDLINYGILFLAAAERDKAEKTWTAETTIGTNDVDSFRRSQQQVKEVTQPAKGFPKSDAYLLGREAFLNGHTERSCPFAFHSNEYFDWCEGFNTSRKICEKAKTTWTVEKIYENGEKDIRVGVPTNELGFEKCDPATLTPYALGVKAGMVNKSVGDNPFSAVTAPDKYNDWNSGFGDAK